MSQLPEKVLFVGLGGIGQRHLRNLRSLAGDAVEVLAWRQLRRSDTLTDDLRIAPGVNLETEYAVRTVPSLEAGLAEGPEAVFVTNPSSRRMVVALEAARAGCHLFLEKPLSHNLDHLDELAALVAGKRLVAYTGYQLRFNPALELAAKWLAEKQVGSLLAARFEIGEYLPNFHQYEDYRTMYASRRDLGGGVILSQIHELDIAYWFFGMPRRLFAIGGHWSHLEIDVEDTASILLECGVAGRPLPVHVQQDYLQRPPSRTAEILGDEGKIKIDLREPSVTLVHARKPDVRDTHRFENFQRNDMFRYQMKHFLAAIAGEEPARLSLADGAASLRIAVAAHQSIASGSSVSL